MELQKYKYDDQNFEFFLINFLKDVVSQNTQWVENIDKTILIFSINDELSNKYDIYVENTTKYKIINNKLKNEINCVENLVHINNVLKDTHSYNIKTNIELLELNEQINNDKNELNIINNNIQDDIGYEFIEYKKYIGNFIIATKLNTFIQSKNIESTEKYFYYLTEKINNLIKLFKRDKIKIMNYYLNFSVNEQTREKLNLYLDFKKDKIELNELIEKEVFELFLLVYYISDTKKLLNKIFNYYDIYSTLNGSKTSQYERKYNKKYYNLYMNYKLQEHCSIFNFPLIIYKKLNNYISFKFNCKLTIDHMRIIYKKHVEWITFLKKYYNVDNNTFIDIDFVEYIFC